MFLLPLLTADIDEIEKLEVLFITAEIEFYFLISVQNKADYFFCVEKLNNYENVRIITPSISMERIEHWQYIVDYAVNNFHFDSFSYVFSGDRLNANLPIINNDNADIKIYPYLIDGKIKHDAINSALGRYFSVKTVIYYNMLVGKPFLAPLQKIVFSKNASRKIKFNTANPYVADQLMVFDLIKNGFTCSLGRHAFYEICSKKRIYSKNITTSKILRQQLYLYVYAKCYIGIPFVFMRTLTKLLLKYIGKI